MPPALGDGLLFLVGTAGAWLLFVAGLRVRPYGRPARLAVIAAAGVVVLLTTPVLPLHRTIAPALVHVGGDNLVLLLAVMLGLGAAFPSERWSRVVRTTVSTAAGLLWLALVITAGSPLYWLVYGTAKLSGRPDADGLLRQSTAYTCAPCAAAMLLQQYGISVTEGEAAQASGCLLWFGTDDFGIAEGLRQLAAPEHLAAELVYATPAESIELPTPYLAGIIHPTYGSHAVVVQAAGTGGVVTLDPFNGRTVSYPVEMWYDAWDGPAVLLTSSLQ